MTKSSRPQPLPQQPHEIPGCSYSRTWKFVPFGTLLDVVESVMPTKNDAAGKCTEWCAYLSVGYKVVWQSPGHASVEAGRAALERVTPGLLERTGRLCAELGAEVEG